MTYRQILKLFYLKIHVRQSINLWSDFYETVFLMSFFSDLYTDL